MTVGGLPEFCDLLARSDVMRANQGIAKLLCRRRHAVGSGRLEGMTLEVNRKSLERGGCRLASAASRILAHAPLSHASHFPPLSLLRSALPSLPTPHRYLTPQPYRSVRATTPDYTRQICSCTWIKRHAVPLP